MTDEPSLPRTTAAERDRLLANARAEARRRLPCPSCGSTADPLIRQPRRLSLAWWDDASCYVGCAACGAFFALLPVAAPFIWQPEVPEDLEDDPNPWLVNPRELD